MHVLRGNHENEQLNERARSFGGGFAEECLAKYGPRGSVDVVDGSSRYTEMVKKKSRRFPFWTKEFRSLHMLMQFFWQVGKAC